MAETHDRNEACIVEMDNLKERISKMEEREEKRIDEMNIISKAMIAIQIANEQTAKTLEKLEQKMDERIKRVPFLDTETKKQLIKYGFILIVLIVVALQGTNIIEAYKSVSAIK